MPDVPPGEELLSMTDTRENQDTYSGMCQYIAAVFVAALAAAAPALADPVVVSTVDQLRAAVDSANQTGGNVTILLEDGTYTLTNGLYISAPAITIAGRNSDRGKVVIEGDEMSASAAVGNLITVAADDFVAEHVTLQRSRNHLVQIKGELDADAPVLRDCILRDSYEQLVKVSADLSDTSVSSDNGLVESCLFEYTAGIGPQFYIGGIDAHAAKNWTVRNNVFRNIISPSQAVAEYAIHFWSDSADALVEKNLIIDCDRGIGFGLGSSSNHGGIIRNNMIYHSPGNGAFADVGIAIQNSPDTQIYNNTIFMEHDYPSAIEYRFDATSNVFIANNLANRNVQKLDGASGTETSNVVNASAGWFVDPTAGDLHLNSTAVAVIDEGQNVQGLVDDFDGQDRTGMAIDIGADELLVNLRPQPPSDLTVLQVE